MRHLPYEWCHVFIVTRYISFFDSFYIFYFINRWDSRTSSYSSFMRVCGSIGSNALQGWIFLNSFETARIHLIPSIFIPDLIYSYFINRWYCSTSPYSSLIILCSSSGSNDLRRCRFFNSFETVSTPLVPNISMPDFIDIWFM